MCMACEEMQLYYAYLDALEEAKRQAQPWECKVTVIAPVDEASAAGNSSAAAKPAAAAKSNAAAKPGFVCDEPE